MGTSGPGGVARCNHCLEETHVACIYIYVKTLGFQPTIKTMGVNITTIDYLRVLIIEIGSTIILMVVEAQCICIYLKPGSSFRGAEWMVKGCRKTPSLRVQTAPELEDAGMFFFFGEFSYETY